MRMEGNLSNSTFGIESMVDLEEFASIGILIYEKSAIDYIYWSETEPTIYGIQGMPSTFKLDNDHLDKYQVRHLNTS